MKIKTTKASEASEGFEESKASAGFEGIEESKVSEESKVPEGSKESEVSEGSEASAGSAGSARSAGSKGSARSAGSVAVMLAVFGAVIAFLEFYPMKFASDEILSRMIRMIITRGLGSVMTIIFVGYLGYGIYDFRKFGKKLLFSFPCLLVALNNLPYIALIRGTSRITARVPYLILFAAECLLIGIFEEFAFRGVLFAAILEQKRGSTKEIFSSVVISSAVFGGVHLLNLFRGAGFGATVLQTGYSFLIGGMCAVILLKTRNIWICAFIHGIYDFCGLLTPTLGESDVSVWNLPTVVITTVLAILVAVYVVAALLGVKPSDTDKIYAGKNGKNT